MSHDIDFSLDVDFDLDALIVALKQENEAEVEQAAAIVQVAEINQDIDQNINQENDQQNVVVIGDGNDFGGDVVLVLNNENNQDAEQNAVNVAEIEQEQEAVIAQEQDVAINQENAADVDVDAVFVDSKEGPEKKAEEKAPEVIDVDAVVVDVEQENEAEVEQNAAIVQAAEINQDIDQDINQDNEQANVVVIGDGNDFGGDVVLVLNNENNQDAEQNAVNVAEIEQDQLAVILQEQDVVIAQANFADVILDAIFV